MATQQGSLFKPTQMVTSMLAAGMIYYNTSDSTPLKFIRSGSAWVVAYADGTNFKVSKSGDTMTGNLTVNGNIAYANSTQLSIAEHVCR